MAEQAGKIKVEQVEKPALAKHDSKFLDLAFAMDCTGSMDSYIAAARDNIRRIVEEIVSSEKSDVRLALVEYRDHPPQETTFVTRVHDFTGSPKTMKGWLDECQAYGGGDTPEAIADALHDVLKLDWRDNATKICVCISDAPPHGLTDDGDSFPNGCPNGIDPMDVTHKLAEKGVTIYMVGCEPSITPYKDFFMAVAYITGGQYIPLTKASLLTQVIIGGAQEEMALEQLMAEVELEIQADVAAGREIREEELATRMQSKFESRGERTKQLRRNNAELESASACPDAKKLADLCDMKAVKANFKPKGGGDFIKVTYVEPKPMVCFMPAPVMARCAPPPPLGEAMDSPDAPMAMPSLSTPETMMSAPAEDRYECVETGISYNQTARVVQKAMKRNQIAKK